MPPVRMAPVAWPPLIPFLTLTRFVRTKPLVWQCGQTVAGLIGPQVASSVHPMTVVMRSPEHACLSPDPCAQSSEVVPVVT